MTEVERLREELLNHTFADAETQDAIDALLAAVRAEERDEARRELAELRAAIEALCETFEVRHDFEAANDLRAFVTDDGAA